MPGQWDESKHPRAQDGKFGQGSGTPAVASPKTYVAKPGAKAMSGTKGSGKAASVALKDKAAKAKFVAAKTAAAAKAKLIKATAKGKAAALIAKAAAKKKAATDKAKASGKKLSPAAAKKVKDAHAKAKIKAKAIVEAAKAKAAAVTAKYKGAPGSAAKAKPKTKATTKAAAPATKPPASSATKPLPATPSAHPVQQPVSLSLQQFEAKRTANRAASTADEIKAQETYTGDDYVSINNHLRQINPDDITLSQPEIDHTVKHLDSVMDRNKLTEPVITHRGSGPHPLFAKLKPGEIFHEKSYMSTTVDPQISDDFAAARGDYIFHITSPPGTKLAAVHSVNHTEKEMLLGRGAALRLDKREVDSEGRHVMHFTVVGQH
jgi:hypothetical protein